jgi:hypothetical protein
VFVKEGKLTHARFSSQWNGIIQDVLVPLQDRKLSCTSFTPRRNDVV